MPIFQTKMVKRAAFSEKYELETAFLAEEEKFTLITAHLYIMNAVFFFFFEKPYCIEVHFPLSFPSFSICSVFVRRNISQENCTEEQVTNHP